MVKKLYLILMFYIDKGHLQTLEFLLMERNKCSAAVLLFTFDKVAD